MICPKCNGTKTFFIDINGLKYERFCNFCHGKDDLDWIEYVIGADVPRLSGAIGISGYIGKTGPIDINEYNANNKIK